jgi:hypothetical protein
LCGCPIKKWHIIKMPPTIGMYIIALLTFRTHVSSIMAQQVTPFIIGKHQNPPTWCQNNDISYKGGNSEESPQLDMHFDQIPSTFCNHKIVENMHHLFFFLGPLVHASWERKRCSSTCIIAKFTRAQDQISSGDVIIGTIIIRSSKHTHTHTWEGLVHICLLRKHKKKRVMIILHFFGLWC